MKQVLQNLGSGEVSLVDVPTPRIAPGRLLIRSSRSLISPGTERMLVDFGRASLLEKAMQQPEKVRMVFDKIRSDGLLATMDAVRSKLDQPLALGYCNAGVVLEVGTGVDKFKAGDRVASNGPHAGVVSVAENLCARIPDGVDDDAAAFAVLASIGLQGIRLAAPTLGEYVVVTGLGLIGLLTVQLLRANGCHVLGIDYDPSRTALARGFGAETVDLTAGEDPVASGMAFSGGRGVDAAIITASTKSADPVSQAARMCRKRGRIVLVGVAGLELNRSDFYEKELTFQVSCSYGPGRYDPEYEEKGHDYPYGLVRWTEQRNLEAVLGMIADGSLDVSALVSHQFAFENAPDAYGALTREKTALGILLRYSQAPTQAPPASSIRLTHSERTHAPTEPVVGLIGAGNYASRILIPAFKSAGAQLDTVVTNSGMSAVYHGGRAGFAAASTDPAEVLESARINTVVIATRHDTHAHFVVASLAADKNVFVEKPLALTLDQVDEIERTWRAAAARGTAPRLMVGFNRRFSPLVQRMKQLLQPVKQPKSFIYTCNAGMIPDQHWTQDASVGGGRIIGEACHFIDLLRYLADAPISDFQVMTIGRHPALSVTSDKAIISLRFEDGSIGAIQYLANGGKRFPKERVEVFAADGVLQLDNFIALRGFGWKGFSRKRLWRQDKGQVACVAAFLDSIRSGKPAPIPFEELLEVARVSIEIARRQAAEA